MELLNITYLFFTGLLFTVLINSVYRMKEDFVNKKKKYKIISYNIIMTMLYVLIIVSLGLIVWKIIIWK